MKTFKSIFMIVINIQTWQASSQSAAGNRVPAVLFVSEDWHPTGRYGDRTVARYREMIGYSGAACSTGLVMEGDSVLNQIIAEWLEQFERNQYILRTSSRLRQLHGD